MELLKISLLIYSESYVSEGFNSMKIDWNCILLFYYRNNGI
ncbi:MAG: hypothetical protein E6248_00895 [Clostridium sp.]|nr:hypothetical protein [Clostridium sp.]MDU5108974.1 hypothetical protein [Clostridium sp.]